MIQLRKAFRKKKVSYFRIGSYFLFAFFTVVGEQLFVALDAVRMLVLEYVSGASQRDVTIPTAKVVRVKILIHSFCILAVEY